MNKEIVENWNSKVKDNDIVYVLGDLMLGNNEKGKSDRKGRNKKRHR